MTRNFRIVVLANEDEYEALEKAAKAAGVPISTYCRMAGLEKAKKEEK